MTTQRKAWFTFTGYLAILVDDTTGRAIREFDTAMSGVIPAEALRWCKRNNIDIVEEPA